MFKIVVGGKLFGVKPSDEAGCKFSRLMVDYVKVYNVNARHPARANEFLFYGGVLIAFILLFKSI